METKFYEDQYLEAHINKDPYVENHIRLYPKPQVKNFSDLPVEQVEHLFLMASEFGKLLFELKIAEGTNIIADDGDNVIINVIPRKQNDELNFMWEPKQGNPQAVESAAKDIKSKVIFAEPKKKEPVKPKEVAEEPVENYFEYELHRVP